MNTKNIGNENSDRKTERGQWAALDGCPITPGPWFVRAATFCDDGIPSFEVVMPGEPRMSAPDARVMGAAPVLFVALKELLNFAIEFDDERLSYISVQIDRAAIADARAALALANLPANESAKRPIHNHGNDGQAHSNKGSPV